MNTSLATAAPSSPVIDPDAAAPVLPPVVTPPTTPTPRDRIRARGLDRYVSGHGVDLLDVAKVDTPAATETFSPVPHHEMYDHVQSELKRVGIRETETFHALWRGGDRYIGLAITDLDPGLDGREVVVGWFNSHDHSHAATFLLGEQVTVCFNLCLYGEVKVARRHTAHIRRDLPALIGDAVWRFTRAMVDQAKRCDAYREAPLLRSAGNDVLIRLLEEGVFPPSHIRKVLDEWTRPTIPQHAAAWNIDRLYQAVTFQQTPLWDMGRRHRSLHRVLDDVAGIAPAPRAPSRA
jgi:hypothetical protein